MDGFSMSGSTDKDRYIHHVCLGYEGEAKKFYDGLGYKFIELVNFTKGSEDELDSNIDKWLYVLKNMSKLNKIPTFLRKTIFENIFNLAEYNKLKKEERDMYDSSL